MRPYAPEDAVNGESNDFEGHLAKAGVVVKFWLQIGKDEQLRRFKERQKIAYKRYEITDEDWRNRENWDAYDVALNEMIETTSASGSETPSPVVDQLEGGPLEAGSRHRPMPWTLQAGQSVASSR